MCFVLDTFFPPRLNLSVKTVGFVSRKSKIDPSSSNLHYCFIRERNTKSYRFYRVSFHQTTGSQGQVFSMCVRVCVWTCKCICICVTEKGQIYGGYLGFNFLERNWKSRWHFFGSRFGVNEEGREGEKSVADIYFVYGDISYSRVVWSLTYVFQFLLLFLLRRAEVGRDTG